MIGLLVEDGDLVVEGGRYREVTGRKKLTQDLGHAMREEIGVDRFHPRWGSTLPSFVGEVADQSVVLQVTTEVQRVLDNAITVQQANIRRDAMLGLASRYGTGEIIQRVQSIHPVVEYDALHVRVALTTLSADEVVLVSTVRTE